MITNKQSKIQKILLLLLCFLLFFILIYKIQFNKVHIINSKEKTYFDEYEVDKYFEIKEKLLKIQDYILLILMMKMI